MFNYSSEVKWIRVKDTDGGLVWINLENVDCIYNNTDGTTTICLITRSVHSTIPFAKVSDILNGEAQ